MSLSSMADIIGIGSALGTVYVAITVWDIKKFYNAQLRIPQLVHATTEVSSTLIKQLGDFTLNKKEIIATLARLQSCIESLGKYMSSESPSIEVTRQLLTEARKGVTEKRCRDVYAECMRLIMDAETYVTEQKLERLR
jgi:hypothetical protein